MFKPLRAMLREPEGRVLVASAISALVVGTIAYTILEGWSPLDSLYFSVVTLGTVGFGDLHPTTDLAKLFTIVYILAGLGILAGFASELTKTRQALRATESREAVSATAKHIERDVEDVVADQESQRPLGDGPPSDV